MSKALKAQLSAVLAQADSILAVNDGKELSKEDIAKYTGLIEQAKSIKATIEQTETADALKSWMNESAGSAVKSGWSGEALPNEGNIEGVTQDKAGFLYATTGVGENQLKALKSGAYKDAFIAKLRADAGMGGALKASHMKVLNESVGTSGELWVPPDYRQELIKKQATLAAIRPNAYSFTTGSDVASFPKVTYTTDDKYTSGARFSWVGALMSSDQTEATNPVAGRENIPVHTALLSIFLTRSQMEDNSFDLLGYLSMIMSEAFTLGEEDVFINGTGVGQPQGILNHPQASTATGSGGMLVLSGAAAAVAWGQGTSGAATTTGMIGTEAALPPQYDDGGRWVANKATYSALRALTDSQLRPLWNVNDQWPNMANGNSASILGHPILKSQFMPDIGASNTPVMLSDLSGYYIADRVGLSVEVDNSLRRLKDEVVIVARKRVGGQLVHYWKTKLMKSNNT